MIFYSDMRKGKTDSIALGEAHYSYMVPTNRITRLFRRPHHILHPEIFRESILPMCYPNITLAGSTPIHVAFRPFGHIRLLKGAINIAHIPWEFSNLQLITRQGQLFDQLSLLRKLDEIWTPSRFSANILSRHLDIPVHFVPTPITSSDEERCDFPPKCDLLAHLTAVPALPLSLFFGVDNKSQHKSMIQPLQMYIRDLSTTKTYILVANPGDWRKNLEKVLRGFVAFAERHDDVLLLIKLVIDNRATRLDNVQQDTILPKMLESISLRSKRIIFMSANLSVEELCQLYRISDFYISISLGEGQNLPLLEAMGQGVVPVSVDHTAMADYINSKNAFVIPSSPKKVFNPELSEYTEDGWIEAHDVTTSDYINALEASYYASTAEFYDKSRNAIKTVHSLYSDNAVRIYLSKTMAKDNLR